MLEITNEKIRTLDIPLQNKNVTSKLEYQNLSYDLMIQYLKSNSDKHRIRITKVSLNFGKTAFIVINPTTLFQNFSKTMRRWKKETKNFLSLLGKAFKWCQSILRSLPESNLPKWRSFFSPAKLLFKYYLWFKKSFKFRKSIISNVDPPISERLVFHDHVKLFLLDSVIEFRKQL